MKIELSEVEYDTLCRWTENRITEPLDISNLYQEEDFLINRLSTGLKTIELSGEDLLFIAEWFKRLSAFNEEDLLLAKYFLPLWKEYLNISVLNIENLLKEKEKK